ncbi:hypothetical protein [Neosynechococcus sphagnicola]|uniref:hypothetical protein n=1 Tax=Neosynechococcus sphagnicola TaxID=1501145 RepID=UPI001EF9DF6D|nr:hypothetical protein [Neosynechococcus sphagnicola]
MPTNQVTSQVNHRTAATPLAKSPIPVGVLGFGGLGKAAARVLATKQQMRWVAAADQQGYAFSATGLDADTCITTYQAQGTLGYLEPGGVAQPPKYHRVDYPGSGGGRLLSRPPQSPQHLYGFRGTTIHSGGLARGSGRCH